jgi:GMP synthase (glutamine-hydrolysing)
MEKVLILDFGSQLTQLITRRVRELNIYSEIHPFNYSIEKIKADKNIKAIIFSGGPNSVYEDGSPQLNLELLNLGLPILGLCYGLQILSHALGGKVEPSNKREYGRANVNVLNKNGLFEGLNDSETVWMSHGDHSTAAPAGFEITASTPSCPVAAMENKDKKIYGIQFHPEVYHTQNGTQMLKNFLINIAGLSADWTSDSFIEMEIEKIKAQVGTGKVLCGLSGGVDSSVTAAIIHKAVGDQLHCMFVDHGLLRMNERQEVENIFKDHFKIKLTVVDAEEEFLTKLAGVSDPEKKRKIIGATFIEVFERESKKIGNFDFLAQGTLYPDVVESVSFKGGPSQTIKSHHNVGGLPEKMNFKLIEPLRELFKDEVRKVGLTLGLPQKMIGRHPFPGPGLAIRIIGSVNQEKIESLQKADNIFISELKNWEMDPNSQTIPKVANAIINLKPLQTVQKIDENKIDLEIINEEKSETATESNQKISLYDQTWQAFCVLTSVQSVGVMGDGRTYENVLALRAVTATDGMTADWAHLPYEFLAHVSNRIINEVKGINRLVYDISSKPPATIEWE